MMYIGMSSMVENVYKMSMDSLRDSRTSNRRISDFEIFKSLKIVR